MKSENLELIDNRIYKIQNDSYDDYLNINNIENKKNLGRKPISVQLNKQEENKNDKHEKKVKNTEEMNKILTRCRSNSRIIPKSVVKASGSTMIESKKPENRTVQNRNSSKDKLDKTHTKKTQKNILEGPLKIESSNINKLNNINELYSDNKIEEVSNSKNDYKSMDKILEVRSHLNKYYEAKTQNQKSQVLKEYMTIPSKNNTPSNNTITIKKDCPIINNQIDKNKILNSLIDDSNKKNTTNNINVSNFERSRFISNQNNRNDSVSKLNQSKFDNKSQIFVHPTKNFHEDNLENDSKENLLNMDNIDNRGIFTFDRNRNPETMDEEENNKTNNYPNNYRKGFTNDSRESLNKYNFRMDFVCKNNPPSNKYQDIIYKKINEPNTQIKNNTSKNTNFIDYRTSNNNDLNKNLITINLDKPINRNDFTHKTDNDLKEINTSKSIIIDVPKNKRIQELNIMSSYVESLSRENPIIQENQKLNHIKELKTSQNLIVSNSKKSNIVYIPTNVNYSTEENNQDIQENTQISNIKTNPDIFRREENDKHSENNNFNSYCLDSQVEQESIRHEINKKLKNQIYEKEYSRVNNQIDYVNERLKLNELSKSYLISKINEYSVDTNTELDLKTHDENRIGKY